MQISATNQVQYTRKNIWEMFTSILWWCDSYYMDKIMLNTLKIIGFSCSTWWFLEVSSSTRLISFLINGSLTYTMRRKFYKKNNHQSSTCSLTSYMESRPNMSSREWNGTKLHRKSCLSTSIADCCQSQFLEECI